jgi:hypothetical protein
MKEKASTIIGLVAILAAAVGVAAMMPVLSQQAYANACNSFVFGGPEQCSNSDTANAFNFNQHGTHLKH